MKILHLIYRRIIDRSLRKNRSWWRWIMDRQREVHWVWIIYRMIHNRSLKKSINGSRWRWSTNRVLIIFRMIPYMNLRKLIHQTRWRWWSNDREVVWVGIIFRMIHWCWWQRLRKKGKRFAALGWITQQSNAVSK